MDQHDLLRKEIIQFLKELEATFWDKQLDLPLQPRSVKSDTFCRDADVKPTKLELVLCVDMKKLKN